MRTSHLVYVSSRELLNALPANAALLSPDGEIKAVNTYWADFADQNGLKMPNYGVGSNYFDVCETAQGPDREISLQVAHGIHELRRGQRAAFSIQYPCHSPTQRRWFLLNATRIGPRSRSAVLMLHEDISALILNQERLGSINSELARVATFISHDLRAPLHTIQSYVELIRRNVSHALEQSTSEYFDLVRATTDRLSTFVTEILNLAVLGSEQVLPTQEIDLDSVVHSALQNLEQLTTDHEATVQVEQLGRTLGNFTYLVQLFQNLVSNAIIHSGQKPQIRIGTTFRNRQKVYFVQDFGPGIPAEFQERMFLPFSRASGDPDHGTGLGLAICRHIVEYHGGQISVDSKPGQGTTVYVSLSADERKAFSAQVSAGLAESER